MLINVNFLHSTNESVVLEELADVDADVGLVLVDAEFLADGAADVDVASFLHVVADVLSAQPYCIEAYVVNFRSGKVMVFEILDESWMGGFESEAVAVHKLLGIGGQFGDPVIVSFLKLLVFRNLACQVSIQHLYACLDCLSHFIRHLLVSLQQFLQLLAFTLQFCYSMS